MIQGSSSNSHPVSVAGGGHDEIDRLRQEVRALRQEIAVRAPVSVPPPRGAMIATGLGMAAIGGAIVTASLMIDLPVTPIWSMFAQLVPTQAAVGIVERIFTVY